MKNRKWTKARRIAVLVSALGATAMLTSQTAMAQLSTATIKGQITMGGAPATAATQVVAVNKDNGNIYKATTRVDGSYALVGLAPGNYEIQLAGAAKTEIITVHVGETASLDLALADVENKERVVIVGTALRADVKTSEVATMVSQQQIENLPQVTRNFMSFADLAPGVRFTQSTTTGQVVMQSGAQNQDNTNVFIDGVGQKNYILRGGTSGLDSTRGNPFPQSAIAEYRVISQNYKAEFDQVSSAALTAVTKSGTNELHGDVFLDQTRTSWTALNPFEKQNKANGIERPDASQSQYGFTLGGPIKLDVMHYFFAYEGKDITTPREVVAQNLNLNMFPANAGIVPSLLSMQGATKNKFKEDLLLGKIDAQISEEQRMEFSARVRRESDKVAEDPKLSVPGNDNNQTNDEDRLELKHSWTRDTFLNEAVIGYEDYTWNPHSSATAPMIKYLGSLTNNLTDAHDVLFTGGSPNDQKRGQRGIFLQDDFTYTGTADHTIKTGAKVNELTVDLSGTSRGVDVVRTIIDPVTGLPNYDPATGNCTSTTPQASDTAIKTQQCEISRAVPPSGVKYKDRQFGIYLQDDWQVNSKLELNLGARWDYEDNALNDSYVTPADRVAALFSLEPHDANGFSTRGFPVTPGTDFPVAPGQTYDQSLAKGGINIRDYISTGSSRKAFTGAIQPRLGFSYDLLGNKASVLFGGLGRAYDRTMANHALDESQKNAQAGGEIWLIKNDHKMPYTDQFSLGLRQAIWTWNGEVGLTSSYSHNQFNWFDGNRDPLGGWGHQSAIDPMWNGPAGYQTLVLGDFISEAKTQSIYFKGDKPFTHASHWGLTAVYTLSDGQTTNHEWTNDIFNWSYGRPGSAGWHPSKDVERHRVVVAGLTDGLLPYGMMLSGKLTLGSGLPRRITDCAVVQGQCNYIKGDGGRFSQVDAGISKDIKVPFGKVVLRADVLNLFNTINYGGYDDGTGDPGNPPRNSLGGNNANLGVPNSMAGPMRTFKLTLRYAF